MKTPIAMLLYAALTIAVVYLGFGAYETYLMTYSTVDEIPLPEYNGDEIQVFNSFQIGEEQEGFYTRHSMFSLDTTWYGVKTKGGTNYINSIKYDGSLSVCGVKITSLKPKFRLGKLTSFNFTVDNDSKFELLIINKFGERIEFYHTNYDNDEYRANGWEVNIYRDFKRDKIYSYENYIYSNHIDRTYLHILDVKHQKALDEANKCSL